ncbi:chlorophyll a/b binding protein domain-containing protein [Artemisia annua]|uniref:Chlorophyll a/b binding protein domain-containing protein n=1 Tax=Artemisia annua TaxID=35608 RepID=A0A2U1LFL4_ARTAN|nr:chlorophyll a/b binding protein domain-containing protein [Artemisia annua]
MFTAFFHLATRLSARISAVSQLPSPSLARIGTAFTCGSPLVTCRSYQQKALVRKATAFSVRCEQSSKDGSGLDVWLGRTAMIGFAVAISVEISTGKGLLENFGLTSPLPTVALAVTALVGVLTAIFIFQSASEN